MFPPEKRIAVFDVDGTLLGELFPTYFDQCLMMHRYLHDDTYEATPEDKEYVQALEYALIHHEETPSSPRSSGQMIAESFKGFTVDEYRDYIREFMKTPVNGFEGMTYGEGFYKPMISVVKYLAEHDFQVFIVSGGERTMVRTVIENTFGEWIPPYHVIGTTVSLEATGQGETAARSYTYTADDEILLAGNMDFKADRWNKVVAIVNEIGDIPILAFGNSKGDLSMGQYVVENGGQAYIPMLITTDQEGGNITRLVTGTMTSGNMALGAAGDEQSAWDNAAIIGSELAALGINTDYGPDADVNNNPANPVINVRSFSSDPELVAKLALAYVKGLESEGVVSTAKHYPGHGDTDTDSHTGLPLIDKSYDELKQMELVPFNAVSGEVDMIMTAHIQFPQIETATYTSIDNGEEIYLPATLSKTMIKDVLRGDIGYNGVVTTDGMPMDAINVNFDKTDAAVLAINADVDILLEPIVTHDANGIAALEEYIAKLVAAVNDGRIAESELDDSVVRIIELKLEKGIITAEPADAAKAKTIVGSKEHHEKELEVAERGITLLKNDDNILPLVMQENEKVAYFYPYAGEENTMTFALDRLKADGIIPDSVSAECHAFTENSASDDYEGLANDVAGYEEMIKGCRAVIIATETYRTGNMDRTDETRAWQAVFSDEMTALAHKNGIKVVHLSMHLPYDADALLCAYCGQDMPVIPTEYNGDTQTYGVNYPAALITVFGGSTPTGKLPVDLPEYVEGVGYTDEIVFPIGYGLTF